MIPSQADPPRVVLRQLPPKVRRTKSALEGAVAELDRFRRRKESTIAPGRRKDRLDVAPEQSDSQETPSGCLADCARGGINRYAGPIARLRENCGSRSGAHRMSPRSS